MNDLSLPSHEIYGAAQDRGEIILAEFAAYAEAEQRRRLERAEERAQARSDDGMGELHRLGLEDAENGGEAA